MSLLVIGSVAFDSGPDPSRSRRGRPRQLGHHFLVYANLAFTPVQLVGVVGNDFPPRAPRGNLEGTEDRPPRRIVIEWAARCSAGAGKYEGDMEQRRDCWRSTSARPRHLQPSSPRLSFLDTPFIFLANGSPSMQRQVLAQSKGRKLAVADTMNFWIETQPPEQGGGACSGRSTASCSTTARPGCSPRK